MQVVLFHYKLYYLSHSLVPFTTTSNNRKQTHSIKDQAELFLFDVNNFIIIDDEIWSSRCITQQQHPWWCWCHEQSHIIDPATNQHSLFDLSLMVILVKTYGKCVTKSVLTVSLTASWLHIDDCSLLYVSDCQLSRTSSTLQTILLYYVSSYILCT